MHISDPNRNNDLMGERVNCIIMGAAGRDFHDFLTFFRDRPQFHVCAFTATQIPFIANRSFPRSLAGEHYHADIPIYAEEELPRLIRQLEIDVVFLAYSDLAHLDVMHKVSLVQSLGAAFAFLSPRQTQLRARTPVVAVTAVRTGAGKSPITQWLGTRLRVSGRTPVAIRHPMPYGDLSRQAVERFAQESDLDRYRCTIEEREEYTPYIELGIPILAGVDYARIVKAAEAEADIILWDGGNNDYPFVRPDVSIVVLDALRPGHETLYYPGETNLRSAEIVVINKVRAADPNHVNQMRETVIQWNPSAQIVDGDLAVEVDHPPEVIAGKRCLVIEDGPTVTHGGMSYGAGMVAARRLEAVVLDPRPFAVGTIATTFEAYPHLQDVLPACGYSDEQLRDLEETIRNSNAEVVIDASPARIDRLLDMGLPCVRIRYRFEQVQGPPLDELVIARLQSLGSSMESLGTAAEPPLSE